MRQLKLMLIYVILLITIIQISYADQPLQNWYKGDQHVHTAFGNTVAEPNQSSLPDMINSAKNYKLDWVVITDHSVDIYNAQEWQLGYDACLSENTANFKCLYSQELSIGTVPNLPDALYNSHYLAIPYQNDNIGWINASCWGLYGLVIPYANCRDRQPVINEVQSAGGFGVMAHPHHSGNLFYHYAWDWSVEEKEPFGIEIFNGLTFDDYDQDAIIFQQTQALDSWVELLNTEINPSNGFVPGLGNSDSHYTIDGGTFTYCYLPSLTTANIRNALKQGNCVASNGPLVVFEINSKKIGETVNAESVFYPTLNIQWNSTNPSDPITTINIYKRGKSFIDNYKIATLNIASLGKSGYYDSYNWQDNIEGVYYNPAYYRL